eukprot:m.102250 g.102250  ORF g.102250 m.102250 type:complete len:981 (-) comp27395_c0_seq2:91-3033(-)
MSFSSSSLRVRTQPQSSPVARPINIQSISEAQDGFYPNTPAWHSAHSHQASSSLALLGGSYLSTGRVLTANRSRLAASPSLTTRFMRNRDVGSHPPGYVKDLMIRAFDEDMSSLPSVSNINTVPADRSMTDGRRSKSPAGYQMEEQALHAEDTPLISDNEQDVEEAKKSKLTGVLQGLMFGAVNGIIVLPVLVGFAHIIFRDPFFQPYMESLTKLVFFSAAVHQFSFSIKSSLPFSIGLVQDAGLIFLSSMSTSIVGLLKGKATDEEILVTVLCWIGISTTMLGVALFITGKLKLAALVQYIPLPVIGGYLAYIGFYCFEAGITLMSGEQVEAFKDWKLIGNAEAMIHIAPGVGLGLMLLFVVTKFRHFLVLPVTLLLIPIGFYVVLAATNTSMEEARSQNWLSSSNGTTVYFFHAWDNSYPKMHLIRWEAIPPQIGTWFAMYFVVAFSSSLDVAAIQMELGRPLDFNYELQTVGFSNFLSGLTGGFTGSYIFSQTIFTMRTGLRTRIVGFTLLGFLLVAFAIPISILSFIPKFFFGAVLSFIAFDLLLEWLWHARHLVRRSEYIIIWITFFAICVTTNLEIGMAIGFGISVLQFIFLYSITSVLHPLPSRSNIMRGFEQRRILSRYSQCIVVRGLEGYIFFGSAIRILREVKRSILVEVANDVALNADSDDTNASPKQGTHAPKKGNMVRLPQNLSNLEDGQRIRSALSQQLLPTRFLVLDFSNVSGVDATAVRSLLAALGQLLATYGISFVVTTKDKGFQELLESHNVECRVEASLDKGLEWCEDKLLKQENTDLHPRRLTTNDCDISEILSAYLSASQTFDSNLIDNNQATLEGFFKLKEYETGRPLFLEGDVSGELYFIRTGTVVIERSASIKFHNMRQLKEKKMGFFEKLRDKYSAKQTQPNTAVMQYDQGGILGELDFFAIQPRSFTATPLCMCEIYVLKRPEFVRMCTDQPLLAAILQNVVLKSLALSVTQRG